MCKFFRYLNLIITTMNKYQIGKDIDKLYNSTNPKSTWLVISGLINKFNFLKDICNILRRKAA